MAGAALIRAAAAVLALVAVATGLQAAWLPTKAWLGQALLERAWAARVDGQDTPRPWPWADTTPVAILSAPRLGVRQLVLDGASGRNLAWGPAVHGTPRPPAGEWLVSGHRDTHFRWLGEVERGDAIRLATPAGDRVYRVVTSAIVDSTRQALVRDPGADRLVLVTCWPLDDWQAGGPLRLVVTAAGISGSESGARVADSGT